MRHWNHDLKSGRTLRAALKGRNPVRTLQSLKTCWQEVFEVLNNSIDICDECSIFENISNVDCLLESYNQKNSFDVEDIEEIDYLLSEFYDFCDYNSIWVTL